MKKIYLLSLLLTTALGNYAQTVADSLVRDSVPILLTDTTSYNSHPRIMIYSGNNSMYEDTTTAYLLFYDKQPDTASYSSIWCRDLKNMTPETLFLPSNDTVRVNNPQATNAGVIFYEEHHDSTVTIKGLLIDPLAVTGLDTVTVITITKPVKMVANAMFVFWLKDSVLCRQSFTVNSGTIALGNTDTITTHATDVCVADYNSNISHSFQGDFAYLYYENNQAYLNFETSYSNWLLDSGLISNIHYNYTDFFFYEKPGKTYCHSNSSYPSYDGAVAAILENDTVIPKYAVADEGMVGSKTNGALMRMAFVPDSLPNVFNYSVAANYSYYFPASDTFVFPNPASWWSGLYAYPFPAVDTIRNIIMYRGFIFYNDGYFMTWDLKIILEAGHDSINALYLVRSSVSDIAGSITPLKKAISLQVFPNPVQNAINIVFHSETGGQVTIAVKDISGREIDEIQTNSTIGRNYYCWQKTNLPAGVYFLSVKQGDKIQTVKFVK